MKRTAWDELVDNRDPRDARRIAIIDRLGILEAGHERAFDDVVQLAGALFGVHSVGLTFVTGDRVLIKAMHGAGVDSAPRAGSLSDAVIRSEDVLVVEDARTDERFATAAVVVGAPHVRFFAGVPIHSGGERLGALALFDTVPRTLSPDELEKLATLGRHVDRLLELRWLRALATEPSQPRVEALASEVRSVADFDRVFNSEMHAAVLYEMGSLRLLAANECAVEMYGWPRDTLLTMTAQDIRPEVERAAYRAVMQTRSFNAVSRRRWLHMRANGSTFTVQVNSAPVSIDGCDARIAVVTDLSTRLYGRSALVHTATHDALTGLSNRGAFVEKVDNHLARRRTDCAVLFLDIDSFRHVNAAAGPAVADQLLASVAARMVCELREIDTIARVGGDEFAVLCHDTDDISGRRLGERLAEVIRKPCLVDDREYHLTASIGVAVAGRCSDADRLIGDAELAMRGARRVGLGHVAVFDDAMREAASARARLVHELRFAVEREEFVVHYQPIVDLQSADVHLEALVRWQHPERGLLAPAAFLEIATDEGLVPQIGSLVLSEVARMIVRLRTAGRRNRVAFNLPAAQLNESFVVELERVVAETGMDPTQLIVEVTESAFAKNATAVPAASRLRELGVGLSIDDFGTGYSSIDRLRTLEVDALKLDRSFVSQIHTLQGRSLARAVVYLADAIGVPVVAEGVETEAQLNVVRALGCRYVQGYLFARPMPEADVLEALRSGFDICID